MKHIIILLIIWNFTVFLMMGIDKLKAKHKKRRISEKTLLLSSLCFGALGGAFGMYLFRHKTLHTRFRVGLPVMLVLQLITISAITYYLPNM